MERRGLLLKLAVISLMGIIVVTSQAAFRDATEDGWIALPGQSISLGNIKRDPTDPRGRRAYFEAVNALVVNFQGHTRKKDSWEVQIYAEDFHNETGDRIPVSQLQWRIPNGPYQIMPGGGYYTVLAASVDYKGNDRWDVHSIPLSLHLKLTNDEYAGEYQSTVYASMIFY